MHRFQRWFVVVSLLLVLAALPASAYQSGETSIVLVPYSAGVDQLRAQALPLTPLALVPVEGELWVLAQVSAPALESLRISGEYVDLGEQDLQDGSLWLVDFTHELAEGAPIPDLAAAGRVLWQHPPHALVQGAAADIAVLIRQGVRVLPLSEPITLGQAAPLLPSPPIAVDPAISAHVSALDAATIAAWQRRLSGEEQVIIGGAPQLLRSRYSWSTGGRRSEQYVYEQLQGMGYSPSYFTYPTPYGGKQWRNIIIDIPGRVDPSRWVLLTAHLDSISFDGDQAATLAPGADDNASGSAVLLAIAALLAGQPSDYSLRLVWFTGEEFGYWGSKPYTSWLASRDVDIVAAINVDMAGYDGNGDRVVELHTGVLDRNIRLGDYLAAANQLYGLNLLLERKTRTAAFFSDHRTFWDHGYTSLLVIENFFDDVAEFNRHPDRNPNYHKTTDRIHSLDASYVTAIGRMALAAALHIAQAPASPPSPTPTATTTPVPGGCSEILLNGGFETDAAWRFGLTPATARFTSAAARSGQRGLATGIQPPMAHKRSYSSSYQLVKLPANAQSITLSLWMAGSASDSNDHTDVMLLNSSFGLLANIWRGQPVTGGWAQITFDLSAFRGRSVYLYLNTFNDGAGQAAWAIFDDISIRSCAPDGATATPSPRPATWTPTPRATAAPTATPSPRPATVTPTATSTPRPATATPSPTAQAATATPTLVTACRDLVTNGGFEADGGWTLPVTASRAVYSSGASHGGARSLQLGLATDAQAAALAFDAPNLLGEIAPAGATYSTAYQRLSLPAGSQSLSLTFWRLASASSNDWQRLLLLHPDTYAVLATVWRSQESSAAWQPATFDLTPWRGRRVVLYFEVYNNSTAGDLTRLWIDDVSLTACDAVSGAEPALNTLDHPLFLPLLRSSHFGAAPPS